jgi:hypothetical protein
MKKILFIGLFLGMLSGCYTQFSTLDEPRQPPLSKVTYEIDSATGDTVKVVSQTDTIVKSEHETCYWTRNLWGEPELRCDNSYYSQDWYLYNDYPWWYNRDPYMYDAYGRCPQYYYYDESCRSCRYYTDRNNYYGGSGWGGGSGGRGYSGNSGNVKPRRTSSSAVPNPSSKNYPSSQNLPKQSISTDNSTSSNQNSSGVQNRRTSSTEVPNGNSINLTPSSTQSVQSPTIETRTEAQAPIMAPPPQPASQPAPSPPPDQSNTNVQSSPPPQAPANNNSEPNDNSRNRRNPTRSW